MTKKIVAAVISAVFLIGACVFGFVYSGLDARFPKAESKVKIAEPEAVSAFWENAPAFGDYYIGAVKAGNNNEKPFRTFSVSGRSISNKTTGKNNGEEEVRSNSLIKSRVDVAYGVDACFATVEYYYVDNEDKQDANEIAVIIDFYVAEKVFYYRMRRYDYTLSLFSNGGEIGSKVEQLSKKCIQSHLNEWIDGSSFLQEHGGSDMEQALYESIGMYTVSIWALMMRDFTDEVRQIINCYASEKEKQTRTGGVIIWEDRYDNEERSEVDSYRIDLTGIYPYFEKSVNSSQSSSRGFSESTTETHYDVFGLDSTGVVKPKKIIDMYSVYSELIDYLMEEKNA